ncbi:hypothetical protein [Niallia sp. Krafla_26]|uniref:hypothetical protein n=1 Tax=Niallia sp. Krafla_26 TaxID=3064703 RepID=UPI003D169A54
MNGKISGESSIMNLDVMIYSIIDQNGPTSIPSICQKINSYFFIRGVKIKPIGQAQILSAIRRKKDTFQMDNGLVILRPERILTTFIAEIGTCHSPWFKVKVDFLRKTFILLEMNLDLDHQLQYQPLKAGSTDDFKLEIYKLKCWDWESSYEKQEIVLDGICWSIRLKTITNSYKSEGLDLFPKEWPAFYEALTRLLGKKLC